MGFFSLKQTCSICGEKCGLNRFQIRNKEWVCPKCFKEAGFNVSTPIGSMTSDDVKNIINKKRKNLEKVREFQKTKFVGNYIHIDENAREWLIPDGILGKIVNPNVYSYDDILDFELLEDGGTIIKGGLGSAVAGGLLFGGVGAIVGGVTGKKKGKSTCSSLKIKITLKDMTNPTEYIELIKSETKKSGIVYKSEIKNAQEILSLLQIMCQSNTNTQSSNAEVVSQNSVADEILKFKNLLDNGIITEEEFNAKKQQLLGI